MQVNLDSVSYAGFWARFLATILDSIIQMMLLIPLLLLLFGREIFMNPAVASGLPGFFVQYLLPLLWTVLFWKYKSATPGKIMMGMVIVDASTGATPSAARLLIRYFGYIVSAIPCGLGFLWVGWSKQKQGFHDMMANTVVIMMPKPLDHIAM